MIFETEINGLKEKALYTPDNIKNIFIPMLESFRDLQKKKGRRIVVMLAAPPAAGKSTLAAFLKYLSEIVDDLEPLTPVGIDGFHKTQKELEIGTISIGGIETNLAAVKGAPDTFDIDSLERHVKMVAQGKECEWPVYSRVSHNPEKGGKVTGNIVLVEGNYLLLDDERWKKIAKHADCRISIYAQEDMLEQRLIERKVRGGMSLHEARKFVKSSDMNNVRLCLDHMCKADLSLLAKADGSYMVVI